MSSSDRYGAGEVARQEIEAMKDNLAFIPTLIDDYGLDPYEFRVYHRLKRRIGKNNTACYESIANIATACKMSKQKVRDALQVLIAANIAQQEKQQGKTDRYYLLPPTNWVKSDRLEEIRQQVKAYRQNSDTKSSSRYTRLTKLRRSEVVNYDVVEGELRRSEVVNYDVVEGELRRSDKNLPIKESIEITPSNEESERNFECEERKSKQEAIESEPEITHAESVPDDLAKSENLKSASPNEQNSDRDKNSVAPQNSMTRFSRTSPPNDPFFNRRPKPNEGYQKPTTVEVWEVESGQPRPDFWQWRENYYKRQGGKWAESAKSDSYSEFYNNRQRTTLALWTEFQEYLAKQEQLQQERSTLATAAQEKPPKDVPNFAQRVSLAQHHQWAQEYADWGEEAFKQKYSWLEEWIEHLERAHEIALLRKIGRA